MQDWEILCKNLDDKIRNGQTGTVKQILLSLNQKKIPRAFHAQFAELARRTAAFMWGLRLLKPQMQFQGKARPITQSELLTYSALLIKIGAIEEAKKHLLDILKKNRLIEFQPEFNGAHSQRDLNLESQQYLAYAFVTQWDCKSAIPHFEFVVRNGKRGTYGDAVIRLNLALALFECYHFSKADEILRSILRLSEEKEWTLLQLNCIYLIQAIMIENRKFDGFDQLSEQANRLIDKNKLNDRNTMLVRRNYFVRALLHGDDPEYQLNELGLMKKEALEKGMWEFVRETDLILARMTQDRALATKIYLGSSAVGFRQKVLRYFPKSKIGKSLLWEPSRLDSVSTDEKPSGPGVTYYIGKLRLRQTNENEGSLVFISLKGKLKQLMEIFFSEFYRPQTIGSLFSSLFPTEYFDANTSPFRITQIIFRLNKILKAKNIPLVVKAKNAQFGLYSMDQVKILVADSMNSSDLTGDEVEKMKIVEIIYRRWPQGKFKSSEVCHETGLTLERVQHLLRWAYANKLLKREGAKKGIRYWFQSDPCKNIRVA